MNNEDLAQLRILLQQRGINVPLEHVGTLASAYTTGDWSNADSVLSGKPFTDSQQGAAVAKSEAALAPGFNEKKAYDTSNTADTIEGQTVGLKNYLYNEGQSFKKDKISSDQSAADNGILYSGARVQKERDLKKLYEDRDAQEIGRVGRSVAGTAKDYQYNYGNENVPSISQYYSNAPAGNTYNTNVATGGVTTKPSISSFYNPAQFNFQGRIPNSNNAAIQTRAAGLLKNTANKLTSTGYKTQY